MFDSLYPDASDAALTQRAQRVAPAPDVPWFKNGWRALGQAVPRAGAEMARAGTSLLTPEAVGAVSAPTMFSAPADTPKQQLADEIRAQDRAIAGGIREFTPSPDDTGAASMVLHDVARFVGKAGAYSLFGGAPAAVAGMSLDEGTNEALRRMDEGVDAATAARLGVTKGIASGIAVALPVAGSGIAQTVGLAAAGGPGGYIAEQAVARKILENADYLDEADKIDPFDPMGLGVSFLGSLLFGAGAHAVRRARARAEPAAAGERAPEAGPREAAPAPEHVDAAHVALLQAAREGSGLHAADDLPARTQHAAALDRASEQLATGQRVEVADLAPPAVRPFDTPASRAVLEQIDTLLAERSTLLPEVGRLADAGDITQARLELQQLLDTRPAAGAQAERALAKDIQAQEGVSYKAALAEAKKQLSEQVTDFEARIARLEQVIASNARGQQAEQRLAIVDDQLAGLERQAPELRLTRFQRSLGDALVEMQRANPRPPAPRAEAAPPARASQPSTPKPAQAPVKQAQPAAKPEQGAAVDQAGAERVLLDQADEIAATDPDMLVMLEGMDKPVKVSELLAEMKAMEAQEVADSRLLQVAAECAIRG